MSDNLPAIGMTFSEAAEIYLQKLKTDLRFKPRTKGKRREGIRAILKSWPELEELDIRRIRPTHCSQWAKRFQKVVDARTFNETIEVMNILFSMAEGMGLRMKNPAAAIEPMPLPTKEPEPPKPVSKVKLPKRIRLRLK